MTNLNTDLRLYFRNDVLGDYVDASDAYFRFLKGKTLCTNTRRGATRETIYAMQQTGNVLMVASSFTANSTGTLTLYYQFSGNDSVAFTVVNRTLDTQRRTLHTPSNNKWLTISIDVIENNDYNIYFLKTSMNQYIIANVLSMYAKTSVANMVAFDDDIEPPPGILPFRGRGQISGAASKLTPNCFLQTDSLLNIVPSTFTSTGFDDLTTRVEKLEAGGGGTGATSTVSFPITTDASMGKGTSAGLHTATFDGGAIFKQVSWDTPGTTHIYSLSSLGLGDNSGGLLTVQVSNKNSVAPKFGVMQVSFLKESGIPGSIFVLAKHSSSSLSILDVTFENNNQLWVHTDPDCAICMTIQAAF